MKTYDISSPYFQEYFSSTPKGVGVIFDALGKFNFFPHFDNFCPKNLVFKNHYFFSIQQENKKNVIIALASTILLELYFDLKFTFLLFFMFIIKSLLSRIG